MTFVQKKVMYNLNENNRFFILQFPCDMRIGINGMCGCVRQYGMEPTSEDVTIRNRPYFIIIIQV